MSKSKFKTCQKKLGGAAAGLILMIFFGIPPLARKAKESSVSMAWRSFLNTAPSSYREA